MASLRVSLSACLPASTASLPFPCAPPPHLQHCRAAQAPTPASFARPTLALSMASDGTIPAGPWASQYVVTSINAPILAGYGIFQIVFGIFLGESVRLWRRPNLPYTRRYRMFLLVVTVLLVFYALFTIEEVCFWGGEACFSRISAIELDGVRTLSRRKADPRSPSHLQSRRSEVRKLSSTAR